MAVVIDNSYVFHPEAALGGKAGGFCADQQQGTALLGNDHTTDLKERPVPCEITDIFIVPGVCVDNVSV